VRAVFLLRQILFSEWPRKFFGGNRIRGCRSGCGERPACSIEDSNPRNLLSPVFEELLKDSTNDFHVLRLRGANRADQCIHLALSVAFGFLHHQFAGNILVGADGLYQQHDTQGKAQGNEGFEQEEFLALAGHAFGPLTQPLYTFLTAELCTESKGFRQFLFFEEMFGSGRIRSFLNRTIS
jgi:hypothetical protein